jgi:hypothetical protein
MADAPELLPCPFCGGEKLKVFCNCVVCCSPDCGASGPDLGDTRDEVGAIAAWNRRAPAPDALRQAREALERLVATVADPNWQPDDDAADAVSCRQVWVKEARAALARLTQKGLL